MRSHESACSWAEGLPVLATTASPDTPGQVLKPHGCPGICSSDGSGPCGNAEPHRAAHAHIDSEQSLKGWRYRWSPAPVLPAPTLGHPAFTAVVTQRMASVSLLSLGVAVARSLHTVAQVTASFLFFSWLNNIPLCDHPFIAEGCCGIVMSPPESG